MMSTISCVCWPSVCLLWRNVYLGLLSIFFIRLFVCFLCFWASLVAQRVKRLPAMQETGVPSLGRDWSRNENGNGNPLQYSCLENSMDRGAWWATVHGIVKSWTWLSDFTITILNMSYLYILEINPLLVVLLQIFYPILRLSFCLIYGFLCCAFKLN